MCNEVDLKTSLSLMDSGYKLANVKRFTGRQKMVNNNFDLQYIYQEAYFFKFEEWFLFGI